MPDLGAKGNFLRFMRDPVGTMIDAHRRYGAIVAMTKGDARGGIFLFGPEYNRQVLGNGSLFNVTGHVHSGPADSANNRISRGLLSMNDEPHREHRRIIAPAFHPSLFSGYQEKIVNLADHMLDRWDGLGQIDLCREMRQLSLAISGMGLFGCDCPTEAYEIGDTIECWVRRNFSPARAARVAEQGSPYHRMLLAAERVENTLRRTIRWRAAYLQTGANDLLSLLVQAAANGNPSLTEAQQIAHLSLLFGASYDTVANALSWTFFLLSQHPVVAAQLWEELAGAQSPDGGPEGVAQSPLLDRVIKESLRILPPIVFSSRVCNEPVDFAPHRFDKGTTFILSHYITHHMPDLFPQPKKFLPERWTDSSPGPYAYLPFGAGAHVCLGAAFAIMTMKVTIAMIVRRYRLALIPEARIDRKVVLTLVPARGMPMTVHRQDGAFHKSKTPVRGNIREMVDLR